MAPNGLGCCGLGRGGALLSSWGRYFLVKKQKLRETPNKKQLWTPTNAKRHFNQRRTKSGHGHMRQTWTTRQQTANNKQQTITSMWGYCLCSSLSVSMWFSVLLLFLHVVACCMFVVVFACLLVDVVVSMFVLFVACCGRRFLLCSGLFLLLCCGWWLLLWLVTSVLLLLFFTVMGCCSCCGCCAVVNLLVVIDMSHLFQIS